MTPGICVSALARRQGPCSRHVARGGRAQLASRRRAALGLPHGEDRLPDRRVRSGAVVGLALASGRLRRHPERRARASRGGLGRPRALGRLHRAPRPAQGVAGAAERLARDPPPHGRATSRRGRRSPRRAPPALPPPGTRDRHRRARVPQPGGSHGRAQADEGAGGALDRHGELRHGADAGVRVRRARSSRRTSTGTGTS